MSGADRTRPDEADRDDMLDGASLREVKVGFWGSYKRRFPAEITP